mmetsp:Transcript_17348/g.37672  ORF Transcript_17348/g.37672 Transcript_17348/m.37672 type:complete len:313 (+) Transcript_17348:28-966(+)
MNSSTDRSAFVPTLGATGVGVGGGGGHETHAELLCGWCGVSTRLVARKTGRTGTNRASVLMVSERQIPQYREAMLLFNNVQGDAVEISEPSIFNARSCPRAAVNHESFVPCPTQGPRGAMFSLVHRTKAPVLSAQECEWLIQESERVAAQGEWTKARHGAYPTTDIPLKDMETVLPWFNTKLAEVIYPTLCAQWSAAVPDVSTFRVVDAFIVKYDADSADGQRELKLHRDGSVVSFNIALNPREQYSGGGTYFAGVDRSFVLEQGEMLSHASGILHGGHMITSGVRYVLVSFVILQQYQNFAPRFLQQVRNC